MRAERESSRGVFPLNPEEEILDLLALCPIISVFTVSRIDRIVGTCRAERQKEFRYINSLPLMVLVQYIITTTYNKSSLNSGGAYTV